MNNAEFRMSAGDHNQGDNSDIDRKRRAGRPPDCRRVAGATTAAEFSIEGTGNTEDYGISAPHPVS
jgi:hypothetical protein